MSRTLDLPNELQCIMRMILVDSISSTAVMLTNSQARFSYTNDVVDVIIGWVHRSQLVSRTRTATSKAPNNALISILNYCCIRNLHVVYSSVYTK